MCLTWCIIICYLCTCSGVGRYSILVHLSSQRECTEWRHIRGTAITTTIHTVLCLTPPSLMTIDLISVVSRSSNHLHLSLSLTVLDR